MKNGIATGLIVLSSLGGYYLGTRTVGDSLERGRSGSEEDGLQSLSGSTAQHGGESGTTHSESRYGDGSNGSEAAPFDALRLEDSLAQINLLPAGPRKERELAELFEKWGAASGRMAYERAKELQGRSRLACMTAAAAGWASVEPEDAWSELMLATNNGTAGQPGIQPALKAIAEKDLGLAVRLVQDVDNPSYLQRSFQPLVDSVAESGEYMNLLENIREIESADKRGLLVEKVFEMWGRYELDAPLQALAHFETPTESSKALLGFMRGWAQVDGEEAFHYALENRADAQMGEALASVAEEWALSSTIDEVPSLIEQVVSIGDGGIVLSDISRTLAQREPELTMNALSTIGTETARSLTTDLVMGEWARADFAGAESYYRQMEYDRTKQQAFWALFNASMQQDRKPKGLIDLVFELGDQRAIDRSLLSMAEYTRASSYRDMALALEKALLREFETGKLSDEAKAKVMEVLTPAPSG